MKLAPAEVNCVGFKRIHNIRTFWENSKRSGTKNEKLDLCHLGTRGCIRRHNPCVQDDTILEKRAKNKFFIFVRRKLVEQIKNINECGIS